MKAFTAPQSIDIAISVCLSVKITFSRSERTRKFNVCLCHLSRFFFDFLRFCYTSTMNHMAENRSFYPRLSSETGKQPACLITWVISLRMLKLFKHSQP